MIVTVAVFLLGGKTMGVRKSIILTAILPAAIEDAEVFEKGVEVFSHEGYTVVEFFAPFEAALERGEILKKYGMSSVFLAAFYQKRNGLSLCAISEDERQRALKESCRCVDAAIAAGAEAVLITSGSYPGLEHEDKAWKALENSIATLCEYAGNLRILLEPGDRSIDAKQLAGPTVEVVRMAHKIQKRHANFGLTMDLSHVAQLGENPEEALEQARAFCDHVHLANCVLTPGHLLYGDKHPLFSEPDASYSIDQLEQFGRSLFSGYAENLTVSIEIINHGTDQWAYMQQVLEEEQWFSRLKDRPE